MIIVHNEGFWIARPAIRAIFVREVSDLRPLRSPTAPCAAVGPSWQAACHCSSRWFAG